MVAGFARGQDSLTLWHTQCTSSDSAVGKKELSTMMTERPYIVVAAIAFDETGVSALQEALCSEQRRPGAELHLVHVVAESATHPSSSEPLSPEMTLTGAPKELQRRIALLGVDRPMKITAHIRVGSPSTAILQTAVDLDADLIIVGTRKRRGVEKLVFGSVAERVLHHAHCPVLVAMPKDHLRASQSAGIEPPCPDCKELRSGPDGANVWCERHSRPRAHVHVYQPSDSQVAALMR
jgi:nucleotide-binding universal stress UspA family protein